MRKINRLNLKKKHLLLAGPNRSVTIKPSTAVQKEASDKEGSVAHPESEESLDDLEEDSSSDVVHSNHEESNGDDDKLLQQLTTDSLKDHGDGAVDIQITSRNDHHQEENHQEENHQENQHSSDHNVPNFDHSDCVRTEIIGGDDINCAEDWKTDFGSLNQDERNWYGPGLETVPELVEKSLTCSEVEESGVIAEMNGDMRETIENKEGSSSSETITSVINQFQIITPESSSNVYVKSVSLEPDCFEGSASEGTGNNTLDNADDTYEVYSEKDNQCGFSNEKPNNAAHPDDEITEANENGITELPIEPNEVVEIIEVIEIIDHRLSNLLERVDPHNEEPADKGEANEPTEAKDEVVLENISIEPLEKYDLEDFSNGDERSDILHHSQNSDSGNKIHPFESHTTSDTGVSADNANNTHCSNDGINDNSCNGEYNKNNLNNVSDNNTNDDNGISDNEVIEREIIPIEHTNHTEAHPDNGAQLHTNYHLEKETKQWENACIETITDPQTDKEPASAINTNISNDVMAKDSNDESEVIGEDNRMSWYVMIDDSDTEEGFQRSTEVSPKTFTSSINEAQIITPSYLENSNNDGKIDASGTDIQICSKIDGNQAEQISNELVAVEIPDCVTKSDTIPSNAENPTEGIRPLDVSVLSEPDPRMVEIIQNEVKDHMNSAIDALYAIYANRSVQVSDRGVQTDYDADLVFDHKKSKQLRGKNKTPKMKESRNSYAKPGKKHVENLESNIESGEQNSPAQGGKHDKTQSAKKIRESFRKSLGLGKSNVSKPCVPGVLQECKSDGIDTEPVKNNSGKKSKLKKSWSFSASDKRSRNMMVVRRKECNDDSKVGNIDQREIETQGGSLKAEEENKIKEERNGYRKGKLKKRWSFGGRDKSHQSISKQLIVWKNSAEKEEEGDEVTSSSQNLENPSNGEEKVKEPNNQHETHQDDEKTCGTLDSFEFRPRSFLYDSTKEPRVKITEQAEIIQSCSRFDSGDKADCTMSIEDGAPDAENLPEEILKKAATKRRSINQIFRKRRPVEVKSRSENTMISSNDDLERCTKEEKMARKGKGSIWSSMLKKVTKRNKNSEPEVSTELPDENSAVSKSNNVTDSSESAGAAAADDDHVIISNETVDANSTQLSLASSAIGSDTITNEPITTTPLNSDNNAELPPSSTIGTVSEAAGTTKATFMVGVTPSLDEREESVEQEVQDTSKESSKVTSSLEIRVEQNPPRKPPRLTSALPRITSAASENMVDAEGVTRIPTKVGYNNDCVKDENSMDNDIITRDSEIMTEENIERTFGAIERLLKGEVLTLDDENMNSGSTLV